MSRPVAFLGPTLAHEGVPAGLAVELRGPAALGDVAAAVRDGAAAVLLVDGLFETTRAVWHKELLWALAQGVPVLGAASLGAVRAAELAPFGMLGIGSVFAGYADGSITDDADVAVLHAPAELGWQPLTEALVDVLATLDRALAEGILPAGVHDGMVHRARALPYKQRTWPALLAPLAPIAAAAVRRWLPAGRRSVKRGDALAALAALAAGPPRPPPAAFEETVFWRRFVDALEGEA